MEERLLDTEICSKRFNNLKKEERKVLYSLKDDPSIIIKAPDKGFVVVAWDREDYLKEAYRKLDDKEVYEQVLNDAGVFTSTFKEVLEKISLRGDLLKVTIRLFLGS